MTKYESAARSGISPGYGRSVLIFNEPNPIPKYALPKGNVFCRMEDYVQMHTPMKLNIGVGGQ